ncbi:MAG: HlyC/CorC family transporter [Acidobacteria bacterium]|nr:HlyC/CorC family transporter [Acidobacteriota bacterium]
MALRFLLLVAITAVNAFFAAAEAALLAARQHALRHLANPGHPGAQAALSLLGNTGRMLSVVQVGVTLASLGMGWVGEETVYGVLLDAFGPLTTPATEWLFRAISFLTAFFLLTLVLVVVGEVVPKNLALGHAERFAVLVAPPLLVLSKILSPLVLVVERATAACSRLFRVRSAPSAGRPTAEELKLIVRSSQLAPFENQSIPRLLDLEKLAAREVMVPRNDIVSLPVDAGPDQVLRFAGEHQFSRFPVYDGDPERIIGFVHTKDLLGLGPDRRRWTPFQLRRYVRKPLVVPESKALDELLDEFRTSHTHMALVVDEFGTITGLVTLEDVLEQVFGEIEDEFDARRPAPSPEAASIEVDGGTNIRDLETQYSIELPADAGFETLAGFLLFRLGYIPAPGEAVEYGGRRFTVVELERNRIARVRIERATSSAAESECP